LIAGGIFSSVNGGTAANNIASWNGSSWSALGTGTTNTVVSLMIYNGLLIAGGFFGSAGGVTGTKCIASWNGVSWLPLGTGMEGDLFTCVYTLGDYNGQLYAGGYFNTAGGIPAENIAVWGGLSWLPVGSGLHRSVRAFTVFDNELIGGGYFTQADGEEVNRIASWNGFDWSAHGTGMGGGDTEDTCVFALTSYSNQLIAGGVFVTAGGVTVNHIAAWNKRGISGVPFLSDYGIVVLIMVLVFIGLVVRARRLRLGAKTP
jgi:hypothetical protein